jgi:hypothetical protein
VSHNIEARSCNLCCSGKAISIKQPECVFVAICIHTQRACAILPSVAYPAPQHFSALYHKGNDFLKKNVIEHEMCVLISSTTFV